jgi:GNAT superfamily N-acetyltransferase
VDPVALAARGESLWHRLGLAALGIGWVEDGDVARRTRPSTPVFLGALSLRAGVPAARLAAAVADLEGEVAVRDAGGTEDLGPFGFVLQAREPWMLRHPAAVAPGPGPAGLEVAPCRTRADVELFERTSVEGFTGSTADWVSGTIHPPAASLQVPGLTLFLARLDGQPIGTAIAAAADGVLNVAGVAVVRSARRQGIGTRLTLACLAAAPSLPAVLSSSEDGHAVYRALGFADVGPSALWWRPRSRAT